MDIQTILEENLWNEICNYIEAVEEFQKMIVNIPYIEHEVAKEVEWCEIFDAEEIKVIGFEDCRTRRCIEFEMPFILSAWKEKEPLFRVTAYAKGVVVLENEELMEIHRVAYEDIEVDSIYL